MSDWQDIATAPKDGTPVTTGKQSSWVKAFFYIPYPVTSRFLRGKWCANFGSEDKPKWSSYDPQPTHWMPPTPSP